MHTKSHKLSLEMQNFPTQGGRFPLATPARGPAPWNPRYRSTICPPFRQLDPPLVVTGYKRGYKAVGLKRASIFVDSHTKTKNK